jgi:hypothetical protein
MGLVFMDKNRDALPPCPAEFVRTRAAQFHPARRFLLSKTGVVITRENLLHVTLHIFVDLVWLFTENMLLRS